MKFVNPSKIIRNFHKELIWTIPNSQNYVFLTFDDCKDEDLTFWVLDVLQKFNVKATFFCTGEYVEHNKLDKVILQKGHSVGNHGYKHLNALKVSKAEYLSNVYKNNQLIDTQLFRPPYGKISPAIIKHLKNSFKIIMWDILTYDFDKNVTPAECLENVKKHAKSGSIIVFHPIAKARKNLLFTLPASLDFLLNKGFQPQAITTNLIAQNL
jgi:peptidoglycan/xylan/chitin deacetylase (PgdA/CDA1 family)